MKQTLEASTAKKQSYHTFTENDALGHHDAVGLAEAIRQKDVSPFEVTEAAIARAKQSDATINGLAEDAFERALETARSNKLAGPFAGIPTFIKDNEDVAGMKTRHGSRSIGETPVEKNSPFTDQFLSLGFNLLGKTTLSEFGLSGSTETDLHGATLNPWNQACTPGGSSGGSASLVAAGVVPLAHGNDGGGSIRIPAACCGLVGLKPTRNRIKSMAGADLLPINLVHNGVLTRSVRDTAHFLYEAENTYLAQGMKPVGLIAAPGRKRYKIGFFTASPEVDRTDRATIDAVEKTAGLLAEAGHQVSQIDYPYRSEGGKYFVLYYAMLALVMQRFGKLMYGKDFDSEQVEGLTRGLGEHFLENMNQLPGTLRMVMLHMYDHWRLHREYDILLSPVIAHEVPPTGYLDPNEEFDVAMTRLRNFAAFTPAQNVTGAPAISMPVGVTENNLPLSVQMAAGRGDDHKLLELAYELEEMQLMPNIWDAK